MHRVTSTPSICSCGTAVPVLLWYCCLIHVLLWYCCHMCFYGTAAPLVLLWYCCSTGTLVVLLPCVLLWRCCPSHRCSCGIAAPPVHYLWYCCPTGALVVLLYPVLVRYCCPHGNINTSHRSCIYNMHIYLSYTIGALLSSHTLQPWSPCGSASWQPAAATMVPCMNMAPSALTAKPSWP